VNFFIHNDDGSSKLEGASYYEFFTGLMLVAAIVFVFVAYFYKEKRYIQDQQEPEA
jgi:POT family proton-dependent oligopeptide transporter